MFNEKDFIAQVEAADTEKLAEILREHTREEEEALRAYLGTERYQRMHSMALRRNVKRGPAKSRGDDPGRGNVVVIHGIMGAELTATDRAGAGDQVWVKALRIMRGWLERLRLADDGRAGYGGYDVHASGIMKRFYGELLLSLSENWNVRAFWYDWRKDLQLAASELESQIDGWFDNRKPVHLVAHSMGGLVARTFIKKYPDRWKSMWDEKGGGRMGGRLVMLGTPNYGSFAIPQTFTGAEGMVRKLALLDIHHNLDDILDILNSFVGSYQMMPSPFVMADMKPLYSAGTYGRFKISQQHLDTALNHHKYLSDVVDEKRMIYVAGYDQPTFSSIRDFKKMDSLEGYEVTMDGDGRVPHLLGILRRGDKQVGPVYYIKEDHGKLASNQRILGALTELLETGKTERLEKTLDPTRSTKKRGGKDVRQQLREKQEEEQQQLERSLRRMRIGRTGAGARGVGRTRAAEENGEIDLEAMIADMSPEERKVEETLTREYLGAVEEQGFGVASETKADVGSFDESTSIEIGLAWGGVEDEEVYEKLLAESGIPVDAVSVGHYIGVRPQFAELSLDRAISRALPGKQMDAGEEIDTADLILTRYTDRGIIQGKLGQPFFLPDPRSTTGRVVAVAGMDEPGRFGKPELTVLARELCWSLGRMGKHHLATVIIGSGAGNLTLADAISAWITGIRRAVTGSHEDDKRRLRRVTFIEFDPRKIPDIHKIILDEKDRQQKEGLEIKFKEFSEAELEKVKKAGYQKAREEFENKWKEVRREEELENPVPARVTLGLDRTSGAYTFGAITESASIPERVVTIEPDVVMEANNELAGEQAADMQLERGRFLEELLMPDDLRRELYSRAPLVMMLDSTTARIHWEMVAQPELITMTGSQGAAPAAAGFDPDRFLGTSRGFTRQLRTVLAPPPEPPPPPRRVLRVLVVADPAEDDRLEGAQEEGEAVANLFESYNTVYEERREDTRVEVVRLFGPVVATRTNVLRELMVRQYDVLHFAGHCVYDVKNPAKSGWIFNQEPQHRLSANELNRIDRIPKFVFSNACESGITPDRSSKRSVDLAPSFAEAFFARGVGNFVCTAWPVDDLAARVFALTLYSWLLGIGILEDGSYLKRDAKPMHYAMREARIAIAKTQEGATTWGAYQHYGNPYFELFNVSSVRRIDEGGSKKGGGKKRSAKKRAAGGSKRTGGKDAAAAKSATAATRGAATKTRGASTKKGSAKKRAVKRVG